MIFQDMMLMTNLHIQNVPIFQPSVKVQNIKDKWDDVKIQFSPLMSLQDADAWSHSLSRDPLNFNTSVFGFPRTLVIIFLAP